MLLNSNWKAVMTMRRSFITCRENLTIVLKFDEEVVLSALLKIQLATKNDIVQNRIILLSAF